MMQKNNQIILHWTMYEKAELLEAWPDLSSIAIKIFLSLTKYFSYYNFDQQSSDEGHTG